MIKIADNILKLMLKSADDGLSKSFEFPSSRDPKVKHKVSITGPNIECNCPGFKNHGYCWHVIEAGGSWHVK